MDSGRKDHAHITPQWELTAPRIDGVRVREVRNVVTGNGITTELFRSDWGVVDGTIEQVIYVGLRGRAVSAWHQHRQRWAFLFAVNGHLRIVLFDPREPSPTN